MDDEEIFDKYFLTANGDMGWYTINNDEVFNKLKKGGKVKIYATESLDATYPKQASTTKNYSEIKIEKNKKTGGRIINKI